MKRTIKSGSLLASILLLLGMVSTSVYAEAFSVFGQTFKVFTSNLTGSQESIPNSSEALGYALVRYTRHQSEICVDLSYTESTLFGGEPIAAHIHGPAAPGTDAGILIDLGDPSNPITGCFPVDRAFARLLARGLLYFNIHSEGIPTGELRGQIFPVLGIHYR